MTGGPTRRQGIRALQQEIWAPITAGLLMLLVGLIGLATAQPLLFPSLGPTAFLQTEAPDQPASRFYNVTIGHAVGLISGYAAVFLFRADATPALFAAHQLVAPRVWASVLAIVLTMFGSALLKASHPPAAATTLLIALGGFRPTVHDVFTIVVGVLIVAVAGEGLRRLRYEQIVEHGT